MHTTVTYRFGNRSEVLDGEKIHAWLVSDGQGGVSLNESKIGEYVSWLAQTYNTAYKPKSLKTSYGQTVTISKSVYGWKINQKEETEALKQLLLSCESQEREPVYSQTAAVHDENDYGNTYVEIDYTNQHLWYYKEGSLVTEADIVSGKLSNGNGSPDGIYKIVYRQSPAVLKGEDYESNVTYFMPFAYNVGIHDAAWRSAFGGNIYINSGSHGCINVPYDCATAIYQNIEVGTPVVAYYREPVSLTSNSAKISNAYSYTDPDADKKAAGTATPQPAFFSLCL